MQKWFNNDNSAHQFYFDDYQVISDMEIEVEGGMIEQALYRHELGDFISHARYQLDSQNPGCGDHEYDLYINNTLYSKYDHHFVALITEGNELVIQVETNSTADVGEHQITIEVKLVDYLSVTEHSIHFNVNILEST